MFSKKMEAEKGRIFEGKDEDMNDLYAHKRSKRVETNEILYIKVSEENSKARRGDDDGAKGR